MVIRDERTPTQKAIWEGILKLIETLPPATGGSSRNPASWTVNPGGTEGRTQYVTYNSDGTKTIREITVTVTERQDSNDEFWEMQLRDRDGALVINGKHYRIGTDNGRASAGFKGFGGRSFKIQYLRALDGGAPPPEFDVDDLWFQGPIPPKHRDKFPDTAQFTNPNEEPFQ